MGVRLVCFGGAGLSDASPHVVALERDRLVALVALSDLEDLSDALARGRPGLFEVALPALQLRA